MQAARGGRARALALGLMLASGASWGAGERGGCLAIASHPEGTPLLRLAIGTFDVSYIHSVTRTPVVESYRLEGQAIVQTGLRYVEHGPGMPTAADPGQRLERLDTGYVATLDRRFDTVVMRVNASWSPRLAGGGETIDLARWGNRALALRVCGAS